MQREDLTHQIARVLGFASTRDRIKARIAAALDALITAQTIQADATGFCKAQ